MKTRRLSQGIIEAYNSRLRIRLKQQPDAGYGLVTIYHLKENKYYHRCTTLRVKEGVSIEQVIELCEMLETVEA